jgi:AcrR family transcriptional regulator
VSVEPRPYKMRARAESVESTRQRILDAAKGLVAERLTRDITLTEIAFRADVAVPTVLRAFGNRASVLAAAEDALLHDIRDHRDTAPPGDTNAALAVLYDMYEQWGDLTILRLAEEPGRPEMTPTLDEGRANHRRWVTRVFAPQLRGRTARATQRTINALVVATDVYTWKLLRRDFGLDRHEAEATARHLVDALLDERR